jgi:hypothetical protein
MIDWLMVEWLLVEWLNGYWGIGYLLLFEWEIDWILGISRLNILL